MVQILKDYEYWGRLKIVNEESIGWAIYRYVNRLQFLKEKC